MISGSVGTVISVFPVGLWASRRSHSLVIMPLTFLLHFFLQLGLLLLDLLVTLKGVHCDEVFDVGGLHRLLDHIRSVLLANLIAAFNYTFCVFRVRNTARFTFGSPEEACERGLGAHAVSRLHRGSSLQLSRAELGLRGARLLGLGLGAVGFR